jgi:hypothetical protein
MEKPESFDPIDYSLCYECKLFKLNGLFKKTTRYVYHVCLDCREKLAQEKKKKKMELIKYNNLINKMMKHQVKKIWISL